MVRRRLIVLAVSLASGLALIAPGVAIGAGDDVARVREGDRLTTRKLTESNREHDRSSEIDLLRQEMRVHSAITRSALDCDGWTDAIPGTCFETNAAYLLARAETGVDAVGAPDATRDNILGNLGRYEHCYGGDHLAGGVVESGAAPNGDPSESREAAFRRIRKCVATYNDQMEKAVESASSLVFRKKVGNTAKREFAWNINLKQADVFHDGSTRKGPNTSCLLGNDPSHRPEGWMGTAKCMTILHLGLAMHVAQDFYLHSNWADGRDPALPAAARNPNGLLRSDLAPFLRFPVPVGYTLPGNLVTGDDPTNRRKAAIRSQDLDKDEGDVSPRTGAASDPRTKRGRVVIDGVSNFARAVDLARKQVRSTWQDFIRRLSEQYLPANRAELMVKALVDETPWTECQKVGGKSAQAKEPPRRRANDRSQAVVRFENLTGQELTCQTLRLDEGAWVDLPSVRIGANTASWVNMGGWRAQTTRTTGAWFWEKNVPVDLEVVYRIGDGPARVAVTSGDGKPRCRILGSTEYKCDVPGFHTKSGAWSVRAERAPRS